jgi:hypothetical protein
MTKYASRKFILTITAGLVLMINGALEVNGLPLLDNDTVLAFVGMVSAYLLGQSYVDGKM